MLELLIDYSACPVKANCSPERNNEKDSCPVEEIIYLIEVICFTGEQMDYFYSILYGSQTDLQGKCNTEHSLTAPQTRHVICVFAHSTSMSGVF